MKTWKKKLILVIAVLLFIAPFIDWEQANGMPSDEDGTWNGYDISTIFDAEFYLGRYGDLSHMDEQQALRHFINHGMSEGRQGHENFNVHAYRERYPDLQNAFGEDLPSFYLHFLSHGKDEGRNGRLEE